MNRNVQENPDNFRCSLVCKWHLQSKTGRFRFLLVSKSHFRSKTGLFEVRNASKVDHGWRAAHQDHAVVGWSEEVRADHVEVHEAGAEAPA
jgi:hypothetical protein